MKSKLAFTLIFIALSMLTQRVSAQIPNAGFENWDTVGSYLNPSSWGTMNDVTSANSIFTAERATPGNPGSSYLKLTSKTVGASVVNGIAVSGTLDTLTLLPTSGFPYNQRPASLTGRWQHMIFGSSQGSIVATLTRWDTTTNSRVTVAQAPRTLSGMAMSWANFSIPFTYSDGLFPDTCVIVMKASGNNPTADDYLWVDNLAFTGLVTSTESSLSSPTFRIYPNPAHTTANVEVVCAEAQDSQLQVMNFQGKVIRETAVQLVAGSNIVRLDLEDLPKGIYLIRCGDIDQPMTAPLVIH